MFKSISTFFAAHKVFILGGLSAVGIALQQFLGTPAVDYKVVGFALVIAILSYAAKNLTGVAASILGVVGSAIATISTVATGGTVSWNQLAISTIVAFIGVVAGPATATKVVTPEVKS